MEALDHHRDLAKAGDGLGGERLVQFDRVEVVPRDAAIGDELPAVTEPLDRKTVVARLVAGAGPGRDCTLTGLTDGDGMRERLGVEQ